MRRSLECVLRCLTVFVQRQERHVEQGALVSLAFAERLQALVFGVDLLGESAFALNEIANTLVELHLVVVRLQAQIELLF